LIFKRKNYVAWAIYLMAALMLLFSLSLTPMFFVTALMALFAQVYQPKLIVLDFANLPVTVDKKSRRFKDVKLFEVSKIPKGRFYRLNYYIDGLSLS
jgi:hypothetical protein